MKSITFACTMSAEEMKEHVHQKELMLRVCIWLLFIIGLFIFYLIYTEKVPYTTPLLFLFVFIELVFVFLLYWYKTKKVLLKYALILSKEFGWDDTTSQFVFKDYDRTLRFRSTDIKKWYSLEENGYDESEEINLAGTTDIIHLKTGEKIVLESIWNESVHKFLKSNRIALGLPEPKRWAWYY